METSCFLFVFSEFTELIDFSVSAHAHLNEGVVDVNVVKTENELSRCISACVFLKWGDAITGMNVIGLPIAVAENIVAGFK